MLVGGADSSVCHFCTVQSDGTEPLSCSQLLRVNPFWQICDLKHNTGKKPFAYRCVPQTTVTETKALCSCTKGTTRRCAVSPGLHVLSRKKGMNCCGATPSGLSSPVTRHKHQSPSVQQLILKP
jgi:hypothetical protein